MDGEWSDGAAVSSSPTVSGCEGGKVPVGACGGVSAECAGSSPAAPSSTSPAAVGSGRRRSTHKRVVTVPLADVSGPRPKGVGEGTTPTDSWAWRKYGQKPIKGSPFPRAYYRCSSSKGCPARKQVERSQADPDKVMVIYSFEHNHSGAVPREQNNRQAPKHSKAQPAAVPEPADSIVPVHAHAAAPGDIRAGAAAVAETSAGAAAVAETSAGAAAAVEVHDDFRWLYDGVSVTSSASPSDADAADEMLFGTMFFGAAAVGASAPLPDEFGDVGALFGGGEAGTEEDAMFAGLGELPECAMVFRRHGGDGLAMAGGVVKAE